MWFTEWFIGTFTTFKSHFCEWFSRSSHMVILRMNKHVCYFNSVNRTHWYRATLILQIHEFCKIAGQLATAWPDLAIYWTFGNFLKALAAIDWSKSSSFFGKFCKGAKIYHFSSEIILKQLLWTFGDFFLVTWLATVYLRTSIFSESSGRQFHSSFLNRKIAKRAVVWLSW